MDHEMYGCLAAEEFHGSTYLKFVEEAYSRNGTCVFAAQINGHIVLAPFPTNLVVDAKVVFFALAPGEEAFSGITQNNVNWREIFAQNRWKLFEEEDARSRENPKTEEFQFEVTPS